MSTKAVARPAPAIFGLTVEQLRSLLDKLDRGNGRECGSQRRRSPRLPLRAVDVRIKPVEEQTSDGSGFRVVTRNLSLHGMAFLFDRPLSVGHMLQLEIAFRKDYVVQMQARVAHCREIRGKVHEIGVEFIPKQTCGG